MLLTFAVLLIIFSVLWKKRIVPHFSDEEMQRT